MQQKFYKRPFYFGPFKTNFRRYSWFDLHQQLICLRRQHCCNASHWVGLVRFLVFSYQLMSVFNVSAQNKQDFGPFLFKNYLKMLRNYSATNRHQSILRKKAVVSKNYKYVKSKIG